MADLLRKERLQPSLLDRLTDNQPDVTQESREARVISPSKLREYVLRDLTWLLNTVFLRAVLPLDEYPSISTSVLNFGIPDLAGKTISSISPTVMEATLRKAIIAFEPRLIAATLKIKAVSNADHMTQNALSFLIDAELWAQPLPLRLFLKTALDLESGNVDVHEHGAF